MCRPRTRDPRGSVPPNQEGCCDQEAFGEEPQGQRFQVPSHSRREQDPQARSLLQEDKEAPPSLEIRVDYRQHSCGLGSTVPESAFGTTWRPRTVFYFE
ncbi:hypothetical protein LINPERPRIM_LOCUS12772 [Linum perenne]